MSEKESLERKLLERATSPSSQHHKISDMEVIQLKAEIEVKYVLSHDVILRNCYLICSCQVLAFLVSIQ